ncbi:hypothetical protein PHMEG_00026302 [Phytophthora megakarya]|uniref:HAT C-terminal dimerisation domain-containing protein n=1 Tax=Phytophthora megakarya TaxID=4795 RepID=A0A225VBA4_9STRA|nr:hypothetical protein PHMEG_00026302 [Phytophthora megakarya]
MLRCQKMLEDTRPGLLCTGCGAHAANLLLKDVMDIPFVWSVLGKARFLTKFTLNRRALLQRFRNAQAESHHTSRHMLSMPIVTRWYSCNKCMMSVLENKEVTKDVFEDSRFIGRFADKTKKARHRLGRAKRHVSDKTFWKKLKLVIKLVKPIVGCIAAFEKENCSLSVIYSAFEKLKRDPAYDLANPIAGVPPEVQQKIGNLVEELWVKLHTDSMGIVFLLDHTKSTAFFVDHDLDNTILELEGVAEKLGYNQDDLDCLRTELGLFIEMKEGLTDEEKRRWHRYAPRTYWASRVMVYPKLYEVAIKTFGIPTSSASAARSWSIHDYIHSKKRNRLERHRVLKLLFIYSNAGDKQPGSAPFYTTPWLDDKTTII